MTWTLILSTTIITTIIALSWALTQIANHIWKQLNDTHTR